MEIQQQQFKGKMFGGLDPEDVDTFLQLVAQEMEALVRENTELKEQANRMKAAVDECAAREKNLNEAILAAQKVSEEMAANARKEATLIVSEAELKAERILAENEQKLAQLKSEVQDIRRQKLQFETSLKSLLDGHYKMLTVGEE